MDNNQFDRFTKIIAAISSRRSVVRGVAAGGAASALALVGVKSQTDEAAAKKKKKGHKGGGKGPDKKKCKDKDCKQPNNPCERAACKGDKCRTSTQPNGTACGEGQICFDGQCLEECEPGVSCDGNETCCTNICVDTETSLANCGECGNACDGEKEDTCAGGECLCGDSDPCAGDLVCASGACGCPGNQEECSAGVCINTNTSFENCGACGDACDADIADTCAGGDCKCGNASQCAGELVCVSGACECPSGQKICDGECISNADTCFERVTSDNLRGWVLEGEDAFAQDSSLTQIVTGPEDPPAPGSGSVKLDPTAFGSFAEADTQAVLRTLQYVGTKIEDITRLGYSIFVPSTAGDPPTMQLAVLGAPSSEPNGFASLVFIPGANGNDAPNLDDWTNYTPTDAGFWVSTRDILSPNDECLMCRFNSSTHFGDCQDPDVCAAVRTRTWDQITDMMPDAALNGASNANGSFSFRIGRGDTGAGHVTNVVFNDDGYFFEED